LSGEETGGWDRRVRRCVRIARASSCTGVKVVWLARLDGVGVVGVLDIAAAGDI